MEQKKSNKYAVMVRTTGKEVVEEVYELAYISGSWFDACDYIENHVDNKTTESLIIELVNGIPVIAY